MTIAHHPDVSTLITCAAGSQPEALCAVIASHLSVCPSCMREVSRLEKIGVVLFHDLIPEPLAQHAPVGGVKPNKKEEAAQRCGNHGPQGDVPAPLSEVIGPWLDDIAWCPLGAGAWHFPIPLSKAAKGDLRLIKLSPGRALPKLAHKGDELALVLRGGCKDESKAFGPGDFAESNDVADQLISAHVVHGCILLMASETELKFGEPRYPFAGSFA
ncbi:MAG: cupin domain-containing protein [Filomicrobium sp.]